MRTATKKIALSGAKIDKKIATKKLTPSEKKQVEAFKSMSESISKLYAEGKIDVFNP